VNETCELFFCSFILLNLEEKPILLDWAHYLQTCGHLR